MPFGSALGLLAEESKEVLRKAKSVAIDRCHAAVDPEHVLCAILERPGSGGLQILQSAGADIRTLRGLVEEELAFLTPLGTREPGISLSPKLEEMIQRAHEEMLAGQEPRIMEHHLVLALLSPKAGLRPVTVKRMGVTYETVKGSLAGLKNLSAPSGGPGAGRSLDVLTEFCTDLNTLAERGELQTVSGRDTAMNDILKVLARQRNRSVMVVGPPGVGKTALLHGLAARFASEEIPASLRGARLWSLAAGRLLSGAKYKGEVEDRLRDVLAGLQRAGSREVLFIDDLHILFMPKGQSNAGIILKSALTQGSVSLIGATYPGEHKEYIEADPGLAGQFYLYRLDEPEPEETREILRGIRDSLEKHHGVVIRDSALDASLKLSRRYVGGRYWPRKAIDLLDEACTEFVLERESGKKIVGRILRKVPEAGADAVQEPQPVSPAPLPAEVRTPEEERRILGSLVESWTWHPDFDAFGTLKVGEWADGKVSEMAGQLSAAFERMEPVVDDQVVARVVSRWSGVPLTKIRRTEAEKLLELETHLRGRVVGQEDAITKVAEAIRTARAGAKLPNRPIGSFIFVGPTGVGKTELAKAIAEMVFDDENNMVRIDMNEYGEEHTVSNLLGAPAGYVGYGEATALTDPVLQKPYQVILLDEIEKAHRKVFNILLNLLDEGRLTDRQHRVVDFTNTVVIMTSNQGSQYIYETTRRGEPIDPEIIRKELLKIFAPEIYNRIDSTCVFNPLGKDQLRKIAELQFRKVARLLEDRDIRLSADPEALDWVADVGFDPALGARPLRRVIDQQVANLVARKILSGEIVAGDNACVKRAAEGITVVREARDI